MKAKNNQTKDIKNESIEQLFDSAATTSLSASEESQMWDTLKEYTQFHGAVLGESPDQMGAQYRSSVGRWAMGIAFVTLFFVGTGAASSYSQPGETLYAIKVEVTEPVWGLTKITATQKVHYQGQLIKNRLDEMKWLSKASKLGSAELAIVEEQIAQSSEEIIKIYKAAGQSGVAASDSVHVLSNILTDIRTQEYLEDASSSSTSKSRIEGAQESLRALYVEEIADFSEESPQEVSQLIETILSDIANEAEAELGSEVRVDDSVQAFLLKTQEALQNSDLEEALYLVGEAEQTMEFNEGLQLLGNAGETF